MCVWEARNFTLSEPHFPQILHVFINPEAAQTLFGGFYGGVITQAQLIKSLAVGDCFKQKPFWLSRTWWAGAGEGLKVPIL